MIQKRGGLMSDDGLKGGFTRRDLVRGTLVGAIAVGTGAKSAPAETGSVGPGPSPLELKVNGAVHRLSLEPRVTLVGALRDRLGLTGTKVVCGRGACGACTVLVDGAAVCSCLTLAHEVAGREITTIEALAADGRLSPLQQAFVEADALQCGFCTSGMILSCKVLLDSNPKPSRPEIRAAVAGNLCRCGTYPHVVDAVERVAGIRTAEGSSLLGPPHSRLSTLDSRLFRNDPRVPSATAEALDAEEV
jgi:aerobic-type carbon monoxide dehydrogenase small subunit (CoxS/CutS family)